MRTRTTSNPLSPGLSDRQRARLLNGRRLVVETLDGLECVHDDVTLHQYLHRGDTRSGGHRSRNLLQFFTSEGKQTVEVRQIKKVI